MKSVFAMMAAWLVLTAFPVRAALPLPLMLTGNDDSRTYTPVWPVMPPNCITNRSRICKKTVISR
ncbi:hypothetical protein MMC72_004951 [Salmonella enterica]|nr:hypothetical protein [Salmonella enterica]